MLSQAVREFGERLNGLLHSSIADPRTLHILSFLPFLEAALSIRRIRGRHMETLERIRGLVGPKFALSAIPRLASQAVDVIEKAQCEVRKATIPEGASVRWTTRRVREVARGEVDKVLVIDAFSVIEFAALLATCLRNGFRCEFVEQYINPRGDTWFVKEQVGRGEVGYLRDYAQEIAEEVGCEGSFDIYPCFDKAIHEAVGDVACFLEGREGKNPFELAWERISGLFEERLGLYNYRLLVTSDHGYNVFEDETGTLCIGHGGGERALLHLDQVSLFALVTPGG